jgi:zinc protease
MERRTAVRASPRLFLVWLTVAAVVSAVLTMGAQEPPPRPLPVNGDVKFPPYEVRTLANGLQVVAVLHHEQPSVTVRLLVRAGAAEDPDGKAGVASLVGSLLDQGTTSRSAAAIADTIDYVGGALGTGGGTDLSFINALVMKDSLALALDLVSDIARNPAFAPEEIERQRGQILSSLKVSYQDPDYVASSVADRLIYGFHPYGIPAVGTPESLGRITRDDLVEFHRRWFTPNNSILAIVGDLTAEEAFKGAERAFGGWPRRDVPASRADEPPAATKRVVLVDRPNAVQTEIRVGQIGIPRKHRDFMALNLAVKVLGGEGANRLQNVLRSERGLTYGASADLDAFKRTGDIIADTDTRSETTGDALKVVLDEFARLQRETVSDRELDGVQNYLTGSFPLTIETPDAIAVQVLNTLSYELDISELETYRDQVNAVTVDDVQRVAKAFLRPERLSIVLVGDARKVVPQLHAIGVRNFEQIPLSELDLTTADLRPRAGNTPAARTPN